MRPLGSRWGSEGALAGGGVAVLGPSVPPTGISFGFASAEFDSDGSGSPSTRASAGPRSISDPPARLRSFLAASHDGPQTASPVRPPGRRPRTGWLSQCESAAGPQSLRNEGAR